MVEIVRGRTYQRTDIEGGVTRVDFITGKGGIIGHTYVPGGTLSSACAMSVDVFKTKIDPQS
jgi:hypothetical protein